MHWTRSERCLTAAPGGVRRSLAGQVAVLAALAGLVTACGTTVPGASAVAGAGTGPALQAPSGGSDAAASNSHSTGELPPGLTGGAMGAGPGGGVSPGIGPDSAASSTSAGSSPVASHGRRTVKIGFLLQDFRFGAQGPDPLQGFKDIVAYVNAHGGLEGRRIDPVFYAEDANQGTLDSNAQQACAYLAQDQHVQLVVSDEMYHPSLQQCLGAAHIPQVDAGIAFNPDATGQREAPYYMGPTTMGRDRYHPALLKLALANRWVRPGARIGVLIQDCPLYERVYKQVEVPAAQALGLQLVPEHFDCSAGLTNLGTVVAQIQSSVLKFRSQGVTAVTAVSSAESVIWAFFGPQAQQQEYYPTYLMTSDAYPYQVAASRSSSLSFPAEQLPQVRGIGWMPVADVGAGAPAANPAQRAQRALCLRMSRTHGNATAQSDAGGVSNVLSKYLQDCDAVLLAGKLLAATGGSTALSALTAVYPTVLRSFVSASSVTGRWSPLSGRRDGVTEAAPFTYDTRCECIRYVSAPQRVP